ncbi:nucleoside phosphorylase domain-containing protein [Aspergillus karnatakaensis]|uniref:nucleoside phosphorylase domain-containing protein n=1 Tax=Aspergillus karnatakaensis TaxID=1810916 RepID=UPI003CCCA1BE
MAFFSYRDYTIAWVCALPLEMAAARTMLDEIHTRLSSPETDLNIYILGSINGHKIAVTCLPSGVYGTISAATVISHLIGTFPRVQLGLMVGIGGGAPSTSNDIRLGDIVVSKPSGRYGGVIQYDYGKTLQGGQFERTGTLNNPPQVLLAHMGYLQAEEMTSGGNNILQLVTEVLGNNPDMQGMFSPPRLDTDCLFESSYHHSSQDSNCDQCDQERLIYRPPRHTRAPRIHYGLIASGDQVIKDLETRDRLAQELGILCFEMEAAGLMNQLHTLVIRGICDYCDSHKRKQWQGYAALTAAAYTKRLLSVLPVRACVSLKSTQELSELATSQRVILNEIRQLHLTVSSGVVPAPSLIQSCCDHVCDQPSYQNAISGTRTQDTSKSTVASRRSTQVKNVKFTRSIAYYSRFLRLVITASFSISRGAGGLSIAPSLHLQAIRPDDDWSMTMFGKWYDEIFQAAPGNDFNKSYEDLIALFQQAFSEGIASPL